MLDSLFYPETIAVIGASRTPGKVGHHFLANLINAGFSGSIVPVNPTFPRPILNTVVALIFGFVFGCYYALLLKYLSRLRHLKINREMDIAPLLEEQVITTKEST